MRPENGAWASDTDPPYEGLGGDPVGFHGPQSDQSACPSEASFTVDSDGAVTLVEVLVNNSHEVSDDVVRWSRPIDEKQVVVPNSLVREVLLQVLLLVQSDHSSHVLFLENFDIL